MRVRIATADGVEGNALYSWLRGDPALVRDADVSAPEPAAGEMGAMEVVDVVLTHGAALGGLAVSVATWLGTRTRRSTITITRADGATLTVSDADEVSPGLIEDFLNGDDRG
ncbi:effector-associated constant component EACC1 [Spirilliplanes yamanashiensis]|uniref:Uncharacterized protein n=1 Tax=Spirilliplanes yamanashiensis TaxID=42233 RepID=A0A8J3Y5L9_9ACTN|nr:hypothetical protein [Spirilliplanes yamanashiensis]MDP9819389.1 hypothetical protein [Spirilliplanes yamanashiensis]GIJ01787.1 hypothetical protein Sya03_11390 [Spirilliplanes yamanashiensis]